MRTLMLFRRLLAVGCLAANCLSLLLVAGISTMAQSAGGALVGSFAFAPAVAGVATITMIFTAGYLLWMYQRLFFGEISAFLHEIGSHLTDMRPVETLTLVPLATLVVVFGLFPGLVLHLVDGTVTSVLNSLGRATAINLLFWQ